jgi:hypothetical protein
MSCSGCVEYLDDLGDVTVADTGVNSTVLMYRDGTGEWGDHFVGLDDIEGINDSERVEGSVLYFIPSPTGVGVDPVGDFHATTHVAVDEDMSKFSSMVTAGALKMEVMTGPVGPDLQEGLVWFTKSAQGDIHLHIRTGSNTYNVELT